MTTVKHPDFARNWQDIAANLLKLGATVYGGPAIMGLMQAELQEKRQWVSKERFVEHSRARSARRREPRPGPRGEMTGIIVAASTVGGHLWAPRTPSARSCVSKARCTGSGAIGT